ncbi:MAG: SRPBCC domain-containing protein [Alphaproteobacteria bacterium]
MNTTAAAVRTAEAFVISRVFDAPRDRVFKAWSEASQLDRWWGPAGMTVKTLKLEFRPGGMFHFSMVPPGGQTMYGRFVYREIVRPERIVFVNSFADADADGAIARAPFSADWPLEIESRLTFEEDGDRTRLTLRSVPIDPTPEGVQAFTGMLASMTKGWSGTLDQLVTHLARS